MSKPLSKAELEELQAAFKLLSPEQQRQFNLDHARQAKAKQAETEREKYLSEDGIVQFVRERIGAEPYDYQEDVLRAIARERFVAVKAPRSVGKTVLGAWFVAWLMECFPNEVMVPIIAPTWRQLERFTFKEVKRWVRKIDKPSFRIFSESLKGNDKQAFIMTSDDPQLLEGAHAQTMGILFDESKALPDGVFDAMEGSILGAGNDTDSNVYALMISTPGIPDGRFYDIFTGKVRGWHTISISMLDGVRSGRISQERVDYLAETWGEDSTLYRNHVLGNFDQSGENQVIPIDWIEQAIERGKELQGDNSALGVLGVDVARYGRDKTAICHLQGRFVHPITYLRGKNNAEVAGHVIGIAKRVTMNEPKNIPIAVDVIGTGSGVADILSNDGYQIKDVNVGSKPLDTQGTVITDKTGYQHFFNLRSAIWWMIRESLDPQNPEAITLPDDDILKGDLAAPQFTLKADGKLYVEAKTDTKKRYGSSTDGADALGLALYIDYLQSQVYIPSVAFRKAKINYNRRNPKA